MFFNKKSVSLFFLFFTIMLLSSCAEKILPNKKAVLPDSSAEKKVEEVKIENVSSKKRYTDKYFAIQRLIQDEDYQGANLSLQKELYAENSLDKEVYTAPSYIGYLGLYADFLNRLNDLPDDHKDKELLSISLDKFYDHFLKSCLTEELQSCDLLRNSLSQEVLVANVIFMLANREVNTIQKMKLLGAAFEVSRNQKIKQVEESYLQTGIKILDDFEKGHNELTKDLARKHRINILSIVKKINWTQGDAFKIRQFESIKPWGYDSKARTTLDVLKKELLPFLPIYINLSPVVRNGVISSIERKIAELKQDKKDLDHYPAYRGITLETLVDYSAEAYYLTLGVYFQKIGTVEANRYILSVIDKKSFIDECFAIMKNLVLWDVAQLSLYSTERLHWKFSQKDIKTEKFVSETFNWSKSLIPLWNDFHLKRSFFSKTFLEANAKYSDNFEESDVQKFFMAVNYNILKTTVFPNMMAFAFYMAKTAEWSAKIDILSFSTSLNTKKIMNVMMRGQYEKPWFEFTNLSGLDIGLSKNEMYDTLYYFFTTKTFQIYGINSDDFLLLIGKTLTKDRRGVFENILSRQKEQFLPDNAPINDLVKWCEGIESVNGHFEQENIHFYSLYQYVTPSLQYLKPLTSFKYAPLRASLSTHNDRYRLELEPMIHTLDHYLSMAERVSSSHPTLAIGPLNKTKEFMRELDFLKMSYLGMQKFLFRKLGDCLFVGEKEAKRRSIDLAFAHFDYFSRVVHPLMVAVRNGTLGLDEANSVLKDFHGNSEGSLDRIDMTPSGDPLFLLSRLTYMLRTRMFLTSGVQFDGPHTDPFTLSPIVGNHLEIPIPENFIDDDPKKNKYLIQSIKFYFEAPPLDFAESVSNLTRDVLRGDSYDVTALTMWDIMDTQSYLQDMIYLLHYEVTMLQMPDQKYINVEKSECLDYERYQIQMEDCTVNEKPHEKPHFMNIVEVMKNLLGVYAINDRQREYMELTNGEAWVGETGFQTIITFNLDISYDFSRRFSKYVQGLEGLFDLIYQMLDSDYLGSSFRTHWDIERENDSNSSDPFTTSSVDYSCEGQRKSCDWTNERDQAREFFLSRTKKPKFVFHYDFQIIADDFEYHKARVLTKYDLLMELESRGDEFIDYVKTEGGFGDTVQVSIYKRPSELIPLSRKYLNNERKFERFFVEETEGFYLEDHEWTDARID